MSSALKPLLDAAANGPLTSDQAVEAFEILFEGEATPSQIGGFLMALRTRGETVTEYAAAAKVMRSKCNAVRAPEGAIDIVGTPIWWSKIFFQVPKLQKSASPQSNGD